MKIKAVPFKDGFAGAIAHQMFLQSTADSIAKYLHSVNLKENFWATWDVNILLLDFRFDDKIEFLKPFNPDFDRTLLVAQVSTSYCSLISIEYTLTTQSVQPIQPQVN